MPQTTKGRIEKLKKAMNEENGNTYIEKPFKNWLKEILKLKMTITEIKDSTEDSQANGSKQKNQWIWNKVTKFLDMSNINTKDWRKVHYNWKRLVGYNQVDQQSHGRVSEGSGRKRHTE